MILSFQLVRPVRQAMTRLRDLGLSLVVVAMLMMQFGMITHALDHLSAGQAQTGLSAPEFSASVTPAGEAAVCLKCLEDLAHSVALVSTFTHTGLSGTHVLSLAALPPGLLHHAPARANQRAPPIVLS